MNLRKWGGVVGLVLMVGAVSSAQTQIPPGTKPDNTGVNKRDYNSEGLRTRLTAEDQVRGTQADVELTRQIRQELMQQDDLSVDAQNVKIITLNGVVTLRGPVTNKTELNRVAEVAQKFAHGYTVRNELQVKSF